MDNPTNLAAGMVFNLLIEADGSNELTWDTYYDFGSESVPDFSAMSDGEFVIITCIAKHPT